MSLPVENLPSDTHTTQSPLHSNVDGNVNGGNQPDDVKLVPGYWIARRRDAVVVVCKKDLNDAIKAVESAGYNRDDVAFGRVSTAEAGEFGGVEIEEL